MKVKFVKAYKMIKQDQSIELPDAYAIGLVKKGVAKDVEVESKKRSEKIIK